MSPGNDGQSSPQQTAEQTNNTSAKDDALPNRTSSTDPSSAELATAKSTTTDSSTSTRAESRPVQSEASPQKRSRWRQFWRTLGYDVALAWDRLGIWLANLRRRLFHARLADYIVIVLDHAISERSPNVPRWYAYIPGLKLPLSLEYLHDALYRIALDPDVRGVVFLMKGASFSLTQAQSMARLFDYFHTWDRDACGPTSPPKEIVVHLEQATNATYLIACAADRITMPPLSSWDVMGLRVAPTYWQDTLSRLGIEFDVVKIAPWKTAADRVSRSEMSDAERQQYNWLLDSLSEEIVGAISTGRGLDKAAVQAAIDQAPLFGEQALHAGLVDSLVYEDQLGELLTLSDQSADVQKEKEPTPTATASDDVASNDIVVHETTVKASSKPAKLKQYAQMRPLLYHRHRRRHVQRIGVLSLKGTIVVGNSRSFPIPLPLVGEDIMGSNTVEQQIRAARKDDQLAAVVVHIDSGGGSAVASDLMWRELALLSEEKPLIVYMGNVAASGGYYIAAPAQKIVAQKSTLTGSIGVVIAKGVTTGLYDKIGAHREEIRRGENAGLYADDVQWDERQRGLIEASIEYFYSAFKERVAVGRNLPYAELDAICNGRVWTGKQALDHGLVDELGDFTTAYRHACRVAGLADDGSVATKQISAPSNRLMSQPAGEAQSTHISQLLAPLFSHSTPASASGLTMAGWAAEIVRGDWLKVIARDAIWFITPDLPRLD